VPPNTLSPFAIIGAMGAIAARPPVDRGYMRALLAAYAPNPVARRWPAVYALLGPAAADELAGMTHADYLAPGSRD
jgi:hypothetical protein